MRKSPVLLFIRGLPGSGKSTISETLAKNINGKVIDPDLLKTIGSKSDRSERLRKSTICIEEAKKYINKGYLVIWCQPFRKIQNIKLLTKLLGLTHSDSVLIEIVIPDELSWKRSKVKFNNDRKLFDDFISKYLRTPSVYEIPTLTLNGEEELSHNVNRVLNFIRYNNGNE